MATLRSTGVLLLLIVVLAAREAMTQPTVSDIGDPEPGISASLAADRAERIAEVRYELSLSIPEARSEPIRGSEVVRFMLRDASRPLVLDFAQPRERILSVTVGGSPVPFTLVNGHLVVPADALKSGETTLGISFLAGDESLNRSDEFLYSLFVPARASLALPCFDQPDLKARFTLTLEIPAAWQAVANEAERRRTVSGDRATVQFAETRPLPSYLFGFVAGRFRVESATRDGRAFRMFHRETEARKVARNRDAIFDLHAAALAWLEDYTGIPYPFTKFDFILVPAFQFSGMEHPGAVLYNAPGLLLDETATQNQLLARANVISHETAHMWFGDLVTMKWFDDVWLKEVFANFMAAKIVNPSFPEINHELRFLLDHQVVAYEVDRTAGANAIRQRLENLSEAGALYGPIIYQKAPVVMRQLERIVGIERFQQGLREYLRRYAFANASWLDLIALLDERTEEDLAAWSRAWVDEPGRPTLRTELQLDREGRISRLAFIQSDPRGRQFHWDQHLDVVLGYRDTRRSIPVHVGGASVTAPAAVGLPAPEYVLPSGSGMGYGWFVLDAANQTHLLAHLADIDDALTRGSAWVTLWDAMLERQIAPMELIDTALGALANESDELNVARMLGYVRTAFWRYLAEPQRERVGPRLEAVVREGLSTAASTSLKSTYFTTYRAIVRTPDGVEWLRRVWANQTSIPGLTFAENDYIAMATELAIREVPTGDAILSEQLNRIENPDRKARFAFAMPALSAEPPVRDRFFASLADPANRRREPWVLDGLAALHHPLRAARAQKYIRPSLDLLREIQRTGDIFFPKRWLDATFGGHNSDVAAQTVRDFLNEQTDYPARLRQIILQSADELFRASAVVDGPQP